MPFGKYRRKRPSVLAGLALVQMRHCPGTLRVGNETTWTPVLDRELQVLDCRSLGPRSRASGELGRQRQDLGALAVHRSAVFFRA